MIVKATSDKITLSPRSAAQWYSGDNDITPSVDGYKAVRCIAANPDGTVTAITYINGWVYNVSENTITFTVTGYWLLTKI